MHDAAHDSQAAPRPVGGRRRAWPDGRPRVLQVVPALRRGGGGVERSAIDVAAALAANGGASIVASAGGEMVHQLGRAGVAHLTLPLASKNPLTIWRNAGRLARAIEEQRIDIVHARSRAPAWSAWLATRRLGVPFVTTVHGAYDASNALKRRYNAIMTMADLVIANSEFTARSVVSTYGVDPGLIRIIHRGVDCDRFDRHRVSAERVIKLARGWRVTDGQAVVLLPARLTRWKGHALLIEALARLGREDVACLMVGAVGDHRRYRDELVGLASARGLGSRLMIVDHCDDMPAAFMLADVVVSASIEPEAFGRVVAEAQAMGRPVVVAGHGGAPEQILPGETGWAFAPRDPAALAAALTQALSLDAAARDRLAESAARHARAHFSVEGMCALTLAVYDELGPAAARGGA